MSEDEVRPVQQTEFEQVRELRQEERLARLEEQRDTLSQQIAQQAGQINALYREIGYLKQASYGMQHQAFIQRRSFTPGAVAHPYAHPAGGFAHQVGGGSFELDPQFHRGQFSTPEMETMQLLSRLLSDEWMAPVLVVFLHELFTRVYGKEPRAQQPINYVEIFTQLDRLIDEKMKLINQKNKR